jgi:hypothetical protein
VHHRRKDIVVDLTVFIMVMFLNGTPHGTPMYLLATTRDCHTEMMVVDGINRAQHDRGIRWQGVCLGNQTGETQTSSSPR